MVKLTLQDFGVENYLQDEFYDTDELTLDQKRKLLEDAKKVSLSWNVDVLDCRKSWSRETIEMSFEDILKKLDDDSHFVFIHRKGFVGTNGKPLPGEYQLEIGFRTMRGEPDYYLFIFCDQKKLSRFITKYHLVKHLR